MAPVPAFKDELFDQYEQGKAPIRLKKEGKPDLLVISEADLALSEPQYSVEDLTSIEKGVEDVENGNTRNAFEALKDIRSRYSSLSL